LKKECLQNQKSIEHAGMSKERPLLVACQVPTPVSSFHLPECNGFCFLAPSFDGVA